MQEDDNWGNTMQVLLGLRKVNTRINTGFEPRVYFAGVLGEESDDGDINNGAEESSTSEVQAEKKPHKARPGTKAEQVREYIAEAKADGLKQDSVIEKAISTLGMSRALAASYVRNNWDKF